MVDILRVNGYHGTSVNAANTILRDGYLFSLNAYDWLGDGVYFWQDAPNRAWDWAQKVHATNAAVLHSVIRLDNCIDLFDINWEAIIADAYQSYAAAIQGLGLTLPVQTTRAHRLDQEVLNQCADRLAIQGRTIQAVRGVFIEGRPIFPDSALFNRAHVQIAVRDLALIEQTTLLTFAGGS